MCNIYCDLKIQCVILFFCEINMQDACVLQGVNLGTIIRDI
jgi:hypothetical protein